MSNCDAASLSRKPRPRRAASISPVVAATSAKAARLDATDDPCHAGRRHNFAGTVSTGWTPSVHLGDQVGSTRDAPANVLKNSRKNTTIVVRTIFGSMSRPKNMMNNGASAPAAHCRTPPRSAAGCRRRPARGRAATPPARLRHEPSSSPVTTSVSVVAIWSRYCLAATRRASPRSASDGWSTRRPARARSAPSHPAAGHPLRPATARSDRIAGACYLPRISFAASRARSA